MKGGTVIFHRSVFIVHLVTAELQRAATIKPDKTVKNDQADLIENRLIDFGVNIIHLAGQLPVTFAGEHISKQILRSGTAAAPNYGEARGAESRADFVHKLGIALKELNESQVWLKMARRAGLVAGEAASSLQDECSQLARILNASIHTARRAARPQ